MKTISKHFAFLWHAERYQKRLYNQYNSVTLVSFPRFQDDGTYVWQVSEKIERQIRSQCLKPA